MIVISIIYYYNKYVTIKFSIYVILCIFIILMKIILYKACRKK